MSDFNRKYLLTDQTIEFQGTTLHRIVAVRDFGAIKAGMMGGFVRYEGNLSHEGNCWVGQTAKVMDEARVRDNAIISGSAVITGHAVIENNAAVTGASVINDGAIVYGDTVVKDHAHIKGQSRISGNSIIVDDAIIDGEANIHSASVMRNAVVGGSAVLYSNTCVAKDAVIESVQDTLVIGPLGSRNDRTTFYRANGDTIMVCCGCFNGTLDEFVKRVKDVYGEPNTIFFAYYNEYIAAAEFAKKVLLV